MTEEELAGLSEEERDALNDEVVDIDQDDDEPVEDQDDNDQDDDQEDQDDEQDDNLSDNEPDESTDDSVDDDVSDDFIPKYEPEPVDDFEAKLSELAEQKKELRQKYTDGEFDIDEYEEQRDAVEEKVLELREANLKATIAAEQNEQAIVQQWQWEQDRFFSKESNKVFKEDPILNAAFSTAVQTLSNDAANDQKPMSWFLEEAQRMTQDRFGRSEPERKPTRKSKRTNIPPNLGDLPAAEQPDVGANDEFSKLDELGGLELEQALAKMSQAEQDRYLRG